MFVLLHQGVYSHQAWPGSGWSLLIAVTVKAKRCPSPGLSLGEEMHVTHLPWCPDPSGGPTRNCYLHAPYCNNQTPCARTPCHSGGLFCRMTRVTFPVRSSLRSGCSSRKGQSNFHQTCVLLLSLQIWILQVYENGSAREEPGLWRKDRAAR